MSAEIKTDNASLKKFGLTMAVALLVIAGIVFIKHKEPNAVLLGLALVFLLCSFVFPRALKYVYIAWMKLAFVLGWINTRILLSLVFYLIFTPIGLIMRLFNDPMERRIDKDRQSYWIKKENKPFNKQDYERQF